MTSKRFWKAFIEGKYALHINNEKEYIAFARLCNEKGLRWLQESAPDYHIYSAFLDLCIICDDVYTLLCVDRTYCLRNDYVVVSHHQGDLYAE